MKNIFIPHQKISKQQKWLISAGWVLALFVVWQFLAPLGFPKPVSVWDAFNELLFEDGLLVHTGVSLKVQLEAVIIATSISLFLAYSSVTGFMRPAVNFLTTLRGISPGALVTPIFILLAKDGHSLKVILMAFAIAAFYLTVMRRAVAQTKRAELNHAYTLRMGPWRSTWEVIIRGKLDVAWEALVQNNLMGWSMLMMVEALVQADGGIGKLMFADNKHSNLPSLIALIIWSALICFVVSGAMWALGKVMFRYVPQEVES